MCSSYPSIVFFFFLCSADPRDLHSFPTRRSSDLIVGPVRSGVGRPRLRPCPDREQRSSATADVIAFGLVVGRAGRGEGPRSEEHTSELQSQSNLVCRLLLEKKKKKKTDNNKKTCE